ncbi:hypothetical protein IQ265_13750 [Nodosilinea sp. LEGE 06152]|uniref:single-stranded DNA-binding protein n=1 Tax=Nodosilinea sp. LEGE 06152 TaxID=2777966 RepID=UPI00188080C6|nr:single-stranded DNA-binding protein [Nodosilinea sp. LEGE 06152]MBE9157880.1 hypothetical protein [Nodosilinea sp. LEGE 06152]
MTDQQQTDTYAELTRTLKNIELALMATAAANPPNWKRPLASYKNGWVKAIGGYEVARDQHGPTKVFWMGHHYTRRAGQNKKYGAAIWFSRAMGKGEGDTVAYGRLITFAADADADADELPDYVVKALG